MREDRALIGLCNTRLCGNELIDPAGAVLIVSCAKHCSKTIVSVIVPGLHFLYSLSFYIFEVLHFCLLFCLAG